MTIVRGPSAINPATPTGPNLSHIVSNPPAALQQASAASVLSGEVLGRTRAGMLQIQTSLGVLEVDTPQQFPPGTRVNLQIQQSGQEVKVTIRPLSQPQTGQAQPFEDLEISHSILQQLMQNLPQKPAALMENIRSNIALFAHIATNKTELDNLVRGAMPKAMTQLSGKVQSVTGNVATVSTPFGTVEVETATPFKPGETVQLQLPKEGGRLTVERAPDNAAAPKLPNLQSLDGAILQRLFKSPQAQEIASAYAHQKAAAVPEILHGDIRVLSILPEGEDFPHLEPYKLPATVAHKAAQNIVLRTPLGMVALPANFPVNEGAKLIIEVMEPNIQQNWSGLVMKTAQAAQAPVMPSLPALDELLSDLSLSHPAAAALLQRAIPASGGQAMGPALLYLAALYAGDIRVWGGQKLLQNARESAAKSSAALEDDFGKAARQAIDGIGGDWRVITLPFMEGEQLRYPKIFISDQAVPLEDGGSARHFIVDVELTKLGHLQLDGYVQPLRLDVTLRSEAALPQKIQQDISNIFSDFLDIQGYRGHLLFKQDRMAQPA